MATTNIGFTCFLNAPVETPLTVKQRIALLSNTQKINLLNAYIEKIPPEHIDHKLLIPKDLIEYVYDKVNEIQELCRKYMRGEIEVTPSVLDADGVTVITPAVMNTPPTTQTALTAIMQPLFDDFTNAQVTAIVSAMMKWTKYDGSGTFSYYQSQIIL